MPYRALSGIALAGLAIIATLPVCAAPATPYGIIARYEVGGNETGYDYVKVDSEKRRLFVAHGNKVEILDADSGKKIGEIPGTHGAHGIELIPELHKGYVTAGVDRTVTVFDRDSLVVLKVIKDLGVKPDALQYDAQTRRLFVVNGGDSGDVSVIDPSTDTIVATVKVGGEKLEQIAFDGQGRAFINDEGRSVIHVMDTQALKATATWPLTPCEEPTGMAIDRVQHRIFSACGNEKLAVVDSDTGHVVATPRIGSDPDGALFDTKSQRVYSSNREGTLSVLHETAPDRYDAVQTVTTEPGARTMAMDEKTGRIFLPTARTGPKPPGEGRAPIIPESFVVLVVGSIAAPSADDARSTYAQELVKRVSSAHPEVRALTIEAVPKSGGEAVVLGSTQATRVGTSVGQINIPSGTSPDIIQGTAAGGMVAREALQDVSGVPIGLLTIEYGPTTERTVVERSANEIRETLRRRVAHVNNLLDPVPYEPDAPSNTYAQQLVDEFIQKHPEIEIMAIHATPPGSDYNIIAGSSIGRLGKKADNDDMRCVYTGKPNLEVNSTGTRFESEMQLHDRSGRLLGALGVVVAYKMGDNKEALHAHADAIRRELEARIPDAASLFKPGD